MSQRIAYYSEKIPNNVDLGERPDAAARARAVAARVHQLVGGHGPRGLDQTSTSICAPRSASIRKGWAQFGYVKMPRIPLGHLPPRRSRAARFTSASTRASRRGRTCPANTARTCAASSSPRATPSRPRSSSSGISAHCPSLYDLRNLFQVNVEEGRHLWAMVYLLQRYFGRDGREEAERCSSAARGDANNPRILGAFNEKTPDWLAFFMFTYFTDRDGKFQLCALAEIGFDPLARTTQVHADRGSAPHVRRRDRASRASSSARAR